MPTLPWQALIRCPLFTAAMTKKFPSDLWDLLIDQKLTSAGRLAVHQAAGAG